MPFCCGDVRSNNSHVQHKRMGIADFHITIQVQAHMHTYHLSSLMPLHCILYDDPHVLHKRRDDTVSTH